jgi:hypothetical protein
MYVEPFGVPHGAFVLIPYSTPCLCTYQCVALPNICSDYFHIENSYPLAEKYSIGLVLQTRDQDLHKKNNPTLRRHLA